MPAEEPDRRRLSADRRHHTCLRDARALPSSPPPSTGQKKLRVLNPILILYRIQPTGKSFRMRVEMCWKWAWQSAARSASARRVSAQSQSSVCVAVTPDGNRGPPLWFTALLLRVLEAFECLSVDSVCSRLGQPDGRHGELAVPSCWSQEWSAG